MENVFAYFFAGMVLFGVQKLLSDKAASLRMYLSLVTGGILYTPLTFLSPKGTPPERLPLPLALVAGLWGGFLLAWASDKRLFFHPLLKYPATLLLASSHVAVVLLLITLFNLPLSVNRSLTLFLQSFLFVFGFGFLVRRFYGESSSG